jgi:hypothetical protein
MDKNKPLSPLPLCGEILFQITGLQAPVTLQSRKNAHRAFSPSIPLNFHDALRQIFLFLTSGLNRIFPPGEKYTKHSFVINSFYRARKIPDDLRKRHGKNRP